MKFKKAPAKLVGLFDAVVPGPPVQHRQMFGFPGAWINSNFFMGLHEDRFVLRLPDKLRDEIEKSGGKAFEPMPGRPMREYVVLPKSVVEDSHKLKIWIGRSRDYAALLKPKIKKSATKKISIGKPAKKNA